MEIGMAIKALRKKRGLTQKKLAEMSGISSNALCSIEKGKSFISRETMKAISRSLQVPTGYIIFSAITDEDIPQEKLPIFKALREPILNCFDA